MNRLLVIRLALVLATVAAYWQALGHGYVDFDDPEYVRDNAMVAAGLTYEGIAWAMTTGHATNWHPTTWLSLMIDSEIQKTLGPVFARVFQADERSRFAGAYHLTNVLLHIVNALLVFGVLRSMTGAVWRSAFAAGVFALHPMHVESVAWIAERKDVLSMFFLLLTVWTYTRYVADRDLRSYVNVAVFFALGLMSKPMLVTLPFALLLLDWWPLNRWRPNAGFKPLGKLLLEKFPLIAMVIVSCIVTIHVQHGEGQLQDGRWLPVAERLENAIVSYVLYMGKLFWPVNLAVLYPNHALLDREFWTAGQVAAAGALLAAITVAVFALCRKRPYLATGWLWFLGTLVPVIGLVQIGRQAMADRYAYIPFLGLYIVLAWGAGDLVARWKRLGAPAGALGAAALAACFALTVRQVGYWSDSVALFEHTLAVTRDNWLIHNNMAHMLERAGRSDEAIAQMQTAIAINPECGWIRDHLGTIYAQQRRLFEAQEEFEAAVKFDPTMAQAQFNLGVVLTHRSQPEQALKAFKSAIEIRPSFAEARKAMALLLANQGQRQEAIAELEYLIRTAPAVADECAALVEQIKSAR